MELKVDTTITKRLSALLKDEAVFKNYFIGNDINASPNFIVKNLDTKSLLVSQAEAATFTLNVFESAVLEPEKVSFIHIYCFNALEDPAELPLPVKFDLSITDGTNTISMGQMSQYQNANIAGLTNDYEIVISNPAVLVNKKALIIVILGSI